MTNNRSPRILIVAEFSPGPSAGDWVNLKKYFRGLDWSQIFWWSLSPPAKGGAHHFGGRLACYNVPSRLRPHLRWKGLKCAILENLVVPFAARHLLSFIRAVEPDLIFLMAWGWMIPLGHRVMPHTRAHWHVALYDMPDVDGMVRRLGRARADRFVAYTDELYRNASSRSVISPAMAEEMRRRTGVECHNFFRCAVEPEMLELLRRPAPEPPRDVIRIGYAGTIIAEPTFALFVRALQAIRSRLKRPVEIHLYGIHSYRDRAWFDPGLIIEHGFVSDADLDRLYRAGTWGLAIMNLEDTDPRYNHYSFPCKFTMSLASGLPLICLGHPKTPLVALAKEYRVGLLLTDPASLADGLAEGLEDFSRFPGYRAEILRCAETEFNAARNRETIHQILYAAQTRAA